ncbi:hypothetical protein ACIKT0_04855 [Hansschlegelia beijingensis]|uniref:hypothetical protein n=1 Tax=Hansschlegelia beijingensis TaxID=1133344 RepID=UPI00387EF4A9
MTTKNEITGRDEWLIGAALYEAIIASEAKPAGERTISDERDMRRLLEARFVDHHLFLQMKDAGL